MKKKGKKIVFILLGTLGLLSLCYIGCKVYVDYTLDLVDVYVASRDIQPREVVSELDIKTIQIARKYILDGAYTTKGEIVGKYTDIQGKIPQGSIFYKGMLLDKEEIPDNPSTLLREGQVAYSLPCDLASVSGNTLIVNQRVDLYVSINRKDSVPIADVLVYGARILSIKDHQGLNVEEEKSNGIPYLITFAVDKDCLEKLMAASKVGTIEYYASSDSYDTNKESLLNTESAVLPYLCEPEVEQLYQTW